jgi:hypothetical protein
MNTFILRGDNGLYLEFKVLSEAIRVREQLRIPTTLWLHWGTYWHKLEG